MALRLPYVPESTLFELANPLKRGAITVADYNDAPNSDASKKPSPVNQDLDAVEAKAPAYDDQWVTQPADVYDTGSSPLNGPNNNSNLWPPLAAVLHFGERLFNPAQTSRQYRGPLNGFQPQHMEGVPSEAWGAQVLSTGAAFDPVKAAGSAYGFCSETTGKCLHSVADTLASAGFDARAAIYHARAEGFVPQHSGSLWASDMIPTLAHDPRFKEVAGGYGRTIYQANYVPKVGDMAIWKGGDDEGANEKIGHIMICAGKRPDGSAIWKCDFTAKKDNFTGLRDPVGHGGELHIFRQKAVDEVDARTSIALNAGHPSVPVSHSAPGRSAPKAHA